jgi:hypothetical protein
MPTVPDPDRPAARASKGSASYQARLRDTISLVAGTAILVAPWFNGDDAATHGAIRLRIVAAAVCAVSLWLIMHRSDIRAEWTNLGLGVVLMTAPFWRGTFNAGRLDVAFAGAIVSAFAISCIVELRRESRSRGALRSGTISLN